MKKRMLALLTAIFLLAGVLVLPVSAADGDNSKVTEARKGVVRVYAYGPTEKSSWTGSAFGVGKAGQPTDIFITNRHVATYKKPTGGFAPANRVYLVLDDNSYKITHYGLVDGDGNVHYDSSAEDADTSRMIPCDILYYDETYDFAILKAVKPVDGRVALPLASNVEDMVQSAQTVFALGYPGITDEVASTDGWSLTGQMYTFPDTNASYPIASKTMVRKSRVEDMTVTTGVVSRFGEMTEANNTKHIQHDATIHGGNSGGPLVSSNGVVLGINTWSGTDSESLNYAIYIDYVTDKLKAEGIPFDTESSVEGSGASTALILVGVVAIVIVAAVLFMMKNKKSAQTGPVPPLPPQPPVTGLAALRLQGIVGQFAGRRFSFAASQLRMGRDPSRNDLVFSQDTKGVSGVHCVLVYESGTLYLQDLGSTYGTFVNEGPKLAPNQAVMVRVGDRIYLGSKNQGFQITQKGGM